jgi:hypothetical protein
VNTAGHWIEGGRALCRWANEQAFLRGEVLSTLAMHVQLGDKMNGVALVVFGDEGNELVFHDPAGME